MEIKEKTREEINEKYKWDLSSIYKTIDDYNKDKELLLSKIEQLKGYKGKILSSSENLYNYLCLSDEIGLLFENLYLCASSKKNENVDNLNNQKLYNDILNISFMCSKISSFVMPELMMEDYKKIEEYIKKDNRLKEYEFDLKNIYKYKKYTLSEKEERLLSGLNELSSKYEDNFDIITSSLMDFGYIKDEKGNDVKLTVGNYSKYIKSTDRRVRMDAYKNKANAVKKYVNVLSTDYAGTLSANAIEAKTRGYESTIDMYLFPDDMTTKIYDNLLKCADDKIDVLHKYFKLIKDTIKVNDMHVYDLATPLTKLDKEYNIEEAKELITNGLSILGKDYVNILNKAFEERWIDFYPNKGKVSGWYQTGSYKSHPIVLANYNDDFESVSSLSHELGHAVNTYLSYKNNPFHLSEYTILTAEVASLTNEILLSNYIVNNSNNKEEKLKAIENILSIFAGNFFGTLSEGSIFEKIVHEKAFNGESLAEVDFDNIFDDILNRYYGDIVIKDESSKYNWSRVSHFYTPFYYYKYSIGISCAVYNAKKILNGDKEYLEKYLNFLKLGGSMMPLDELKTLGIDLGKEDVIKLAIDYFDNLIDEYIRIKNE